jgi:multidrug efflux pump subunit AcrA (membrane-fusion protein)
VPESAVLYDADRKPFVEVVDAGSPDGRRRVPVTVGKGNGSRMQVLSGLNPGDQVVLPG